MKFKKMKNRKRLFTFTMSMTMSIIFIIVALFSKNVPVINNTFLVSARMLDSEIAKETNDLPIKSNIKLEDITDNYIENKNNSIVFLNDEDYKKEVERIKLKKIEEQKQKELEEKEKEKQELNDKISIVDDFLVRNNAGVLIGQGSTIVNTVNNYGLKLDEFLAIIIHESGWGRSYASYTYNNISGSMGSNGLMDFSSGITLSDGTLLQGVEGSIIFTARNLKLNYYDKGLTTLETIQPVYAPVGASNDPNGINNVWVTNTRSLVYTINGYNIY